MAWRTAAEQIGVQGLAIPEEMGGGGYGFDELAIVMEESGRTLFPSPLLSTAVLATSALLSVGGPQAAEYLARIAGGDLIATVAVSEAKLHWDSDDIATVASESGGRWTLTGTKPYVLDGAQADVILVAARTAAGVSLFAVESGADGLSVDPLDAMDQTRRMAAVGFSETPAVLLGGDGSGWDTLSSVYDRALAALACEQVGGAQSVLEMTVEYLNVRHQFGRPIGSFQAIKHRCADLLVEVESARSAAAYASARWPPGLKTRPSRPRSRRCTARRRSITLRPRAFRCTAASASPGSTPRICISSGQRVRRRCSAGPPITATGSRKLIGLV